MVKSRLFPILPRLSEIAPSPNADWPLIAHRLTRSQPRLNTTHFLEQTLPESVHTEETEEGEYRVWLAGSDIQQLLDHAGTKDITRELAFALAARSGLRSEEVTDVTPSDVHHDDTIGWLVTVPDGKGGKHRESPTPAEYAKLVTALGTDPHEPVIDVTSP